MRTGLARRRLDRDLCFVKELWDVSADFEEKCHDLAENIDDEYLFNFVKVGCKSGGISG